MHPVLAVIYHDPAGGMLPLVQRALPVVREIFPRIALYASAQAFRPSLDLFAAAGALVEQASGADTQDSGWQPGAGGAVGRGIGPARRGALRLALQLAAPYIFYADGDSLLHWADAYPDELACTATAIQEWDFTIIGRTPQAYATLPRTRRETEAISNRAFALVFGKPWDSQAGARGLSARAAQAVLEGTYDDTFTGDETWPLHLKGLGGYTFGYLEVNGMEFESSEKHPQEVAQAGGKEAWRDAIDQDPHQWLLRTRMAAQAIEAMLPFAPQKSR